MLNLKVEGQDSDGQAVISGAMSDGSVRIISGRFQPRTVGSALTLEYYVPAKKLFGYAEFKLDVNRTRLTGTYYEPNDTGNWVLERASGFKPKTIEKLNTLTDLKENKRSTTLTNIVGLWDSTFGPVELVSTGYSRGVLVKGKFTRPDGKVGNIVSGTFTRNPQGGTLKFLYVTPWNNGSGSGTFHPDPHVPNWQLLGMYEENGQKGTWNLCRSMSK